MYIAIIRAKRVKKGRKKQKDVKRVDKYKKEVWYKKCFSKV